MVSVIIPYYNPGESRELEVLLHRAITSSIRELDGAVDYEIVVVDDGSPHLKPTAFVESLHCERVRLILASHGSLGAARNRGVEACTGSHVLFLDADDYYYPGTLLPCLETMVKCGADLLLFAARECFSMEVQRVEQSLSFHGAMPGEKYMRSHNLRGSSCCMIVERLLLHRHELRFSEHTYVEDEEFTTKAVFFSRRLVFTDSKVYAYYQRSTSIINSTARSRLTECTLNTLKQLLEFRELYCNMPHKGLDRKIATLALDLIRRTLRDEGWRENLEYVTDRLDKLGLFPLPLVRNSLRYHVYNAALHTRLSLPFLKHLESLRV